MKKKVGFLACAALLVMAFAGMAMAADDVIKVGYLAALTGDWAAYGQTEANSAQLAVDEINANGGVLGKKIELVVSDFRTRP